MPCYILLMKHILPFYFRQCSLSQTLMELPVNVLFPYIYVLVSAEMGITVSCPFSNDSDLESSIDVVVKSISFGGGNGEKTPMRSISFKGLDSDPTILKSLGSGKTLIEGSVSFKRSDSGTVISITPPSPIVKHNEKLSNLIDEETLDPSSPKHEAATKLQKVYKSFRTRRKLADCAVLVEQSWYFSFFESKLSFFFVRCWENG